jgi:hypothetical protein
VLLLVIILVGVICRNFYGVLAGLRRLADVTPSAVRMRLVVTLVIPFFIYCDCVYFALDSYWLRKLRVAFNACVRCVYRRRIFDHISDGSDSILGCSLLTYMEFRLACFMFSLVTGGRPCYLYDSLVFSRSERTLRINPPRLSTWLDLYRPVESGFSLSLYLFLFSLSIIFLSLLSFPLYYLSLSIIFLSLYYLSLSIIFLSLLPFSLYYISLSIMFLFTFSL